MASQTTSEAAGNKQKPRRSRATKPFPLMEFQEARSLPTTIVEHGVDGQMRRLTLLDKMGKSPSSSATRALIIASSKYGLTTGSYNASSLVVTEEGRAVSAPNDSREKTQTMFDLAIGRFEPFKKLYEKLRDKRLPDETVLRDELGHAGISEADREKASAVFVANVRYLKLVKAVSGTDYVKTLEEELDQIVSHPSHPTNPEETPTTTGQSQHPHPDISSPGAATPQARTTSEPSLHIDVQVHIDASASAAQIDQIFSSMAKHLYGRDG